MGTETIEPRSPSAKGTLSIVDKLCAYQAAWLAREHSQRYGWHSFAVPIITTTARRAANILELIRSHDLLRQSKLFMVTDQPALEQSPDIFTHLWATRTGTPVPLVPAELLAALPL